MKRENVFKKLLFVFVVIFTVAMMSACSSEDATEDDWDEVAAEEDGDWVDEEDAGDWDDDLWAAEMEDEADENGDDGGEQAPQSSAMEDVDDELEETVLDALPILLPTDDRHLVYTIELDLESTEFKLALRMLMDQIAELEGYNEHVVERGRSLHHPDQERSANLSVRIPNGNLLAFLTFIDDNAGEYNRVFFEMELDDITFEYERTDANLDRLREQEEQILDELASDGYEEPDVTADDLAEVREQIRDLEESNIEAQRNIDYSSIAIRLSEVIMPEVEEPEEPVEPETFGDRLQDAASSSLGGLLGVFQNILLFVIIILPWLLLVALVVVPIGYAVKKYRQNGSSEMPHEHGESNEADGSEKSVE